MCFSAVGSASADWLPSGSPGAAVIDCGYRPQFIVGMLNCAPSLMPDGQRAVTVLVRV